MTNEQAHTMAWIIEKNFGMQAGAIQNCVLLIIEDGREALIYPSGQYRVVKLGQVHEAKRLAE